jgi:hypothetical protein
MENDDKKRAKVFKDRAKLYTKSFKNWFSSTGAALPFGRSQTYRFAQSSFFASLAFSNTDVMGLKIGQIKHLVLNNLRYWFKQNIFLKDGILSIGYAYPNSNMTEGYNAPGSPYWALKTFLLLAIDDNDEFWTSKEESVEFDEKDLQIHPRMLILHNEIGNEVQAFTMGQHSHEHAHADAKYEKYVYSTTFGFSVPKANTMLKQGAFDNTLAISDNGSHYFSAYGYTDYKISNNLLYSKWEPYDNVIIENFIIPKMAYHIRIHKIKSDKKLFVAEGAFSTHYKGTAIQNKNSIYFENKLGVVGIKEITNSLTPELIIPEPNTNLLYSKTVLPTLVGELDKGEHFIASLVVGDVEVSRVVDLKGLKGLNDLKMSVNNNVINVKYDNTSYTFNLNEFNLEKFDLNEFDLNKKLRT